ncbi:hypothetical protein [Catenibacterium sp. co_0103]|uniref:hypothetical protein n=1 Tax=Catenibacterium sp. co_0103 TaxID=2478954 RepID=UPI002478A314|nr:hypothetical protein [Catenibacterium sp. co_0103]
MKFSRFSYIELTLSKERPIVFRCLINAFKFYGGVPKRILFDNMSTVIDTNVKPKRVNHKMVQFAKDMNFRGGNHARPDMPIQKEPMRLAIRLWTGLEATVVSLTP